MRREEHEKGYMNVIDVFERTHVDVHTLVIIRDYNIIIKGEWFHDHILNYSHRIVYSYQHFPISNKVVIECAGTWNAPEIYLKEDDSGMVIFRTPNGYAYETQCDEGIDDDEDM